MKLDRPTAALILAVVLIGCRSAPVPPEVAEAERQERDLRGAGASQYAGPEHEGYLRALKSARRSYQRENLKLGWLRDYGPVRREFRAVIDEGGRIGRDVRARKARKAGSVQETAAAVWGKLKTLEGITVSLGVRGRPREDLARASVLLTEAGRLMEGEKYEDASARLAQADILIGGVERAVNAALGRYLDREQVRAWKRLADEAVAESRRKRTTVLVVSKLEKKLMLYRDGVLRRTYDVGLGFNGLADKRHAGDDATPEGRYAVIRKLPVSQYHKALLIDYPNEEDRRAFARDKKRGALPGSVGIGGQIEIHGGGRDGLTRGCVALDDGDMDDLFDRVPVGTQVAIVGTTDGDSPILETVRRI